MKSKIRSILLSLAIAIGLWVYMITVVNPDFEKTYRNVKVELINDEIMRSRGLVITEYTESVTLKLKGSRGNLVNLSNENMIVTANVSAYASVGTHRIAYVPDYPGNVPSSAITVQSHSPDFVTIKVERLAEAEVPVELIISGKVSDNFDIEEESASYPEFIQVTGPESMVAQLNKAVVYIAADGAEEDISGAFSYVWKNEQGETVEVDSRFVTADMDTVEVVVPIRQYKTVPLKLDVIPGGGLDASAVTIEPSTIEISGSKQLLAGIDSIQIGQIDLAQWHKGEELPKFSITMPGKEIRNETGITEASVTVNFGDLDYATLMVDKITIVNVPEGKTAKLLTTNLIVQLRGPKSQVNAIRNTDLTVTVDASAASDGKSSVKPIITVSEKFDKVGVTGSYSVALMLTDE